MNCNVLEKKKPEEEKKRKLSMTSEKRWELLPWETLVQE